MIISYPSRYVVIMILIISSFCMTIFVHVRYREVPLFHCITQITNSRRNGSKKLSHSEKISFNAEGYPILLSKVVIHSHLSRESQRLFITFAVRIPSVQEVNKFVYHSYKLNRCCTYILKAFTSRKHQRLQWLHFCTASLNLPNFAIQLIYIYNWWIKFLNNIFPSSTSCGWYSTSSIILILQWVKWPKALLASQPPAPAPGGFLACCCLFFSFLEMRWWSRRRWLQQVVCRWR